MGRPKGTKRPTNSAHVLGRGTGQLCGVCFRGGGEESTEESESEIRSESGSESKDNERENMQIDTETSAKYERFA